MRIVAGRHKGRALVTPKGSQTRPTSDRARESLFNVLAHASWLPEAWALDGARVIDLFAGVGALGLEAVSRGATFALFVDTDAAARGVIRQNCETLQATGLTRIHRRDASQLGDKPAGLGAPFDLAFLDPPYGKNLTAPALAALHDGGWLADHAVVVVEVAHDEPDPQASGFITQDVRSYGEAKIGFLTRDLKTD